MAKNMFYKDKKKILEKPAVFLDRDGVLTKEKGYVRSLSEMEIFSYSEECVRQIHKMGYGAIVVTNQSGIARGYFAEEELKRMNTYLKEQTGVDEIYYCPHHAEGLIPKYTKVCRCRKPKTGLIEKACRDFKIDLEHSWMIGDRNSDILLGINAGVHTILVESKYGSKELEEGVVPDKIVRDLTEAIEIIAGTLKI